VTDWIRYPTDEMSLRMLMEACTCNEETGRSHLQEFLMMTARIESVTNEATGEKFSDMEAAQEAVSVYDHDGPPVFFVEHEPGSEPHSEHTVIISLAEEILRLRGESA
jgi:hypothetical protein